VEKGKGMNLRKPSQPQRKFLVLMAMAVIMSALLGMAAPAPATTIAAGSYHSIGMRADGTVAAWGYNNAGQTIVPDGLNGVVAVAAGSLHNLALKSDGTVVAWGYNNYGQGTVPEGLSGVVAVAAGALHNLALRDPFEAEGSNVIGWGNNDYGQCTPPDPLSKFVAVAAGTLHSLALKADGTVVVWGDNACGQCNIPSGLTGVVAVAAGALHSLALKSDGTVVVWGDNTCGQCVVPDGLSGVVAVAAGNWHNLALKSDGTVVAWGYNNHGQGTVPEGLSGVVAVAAGNWHNLALKSDGTVVAWGIEDFGVCNVPAATTFALAPIAKIVPHEAVAPGTLVTVNGSNSNDYDQNYPLFYHFEITNLPPGSLPGGSIQKGYWSPSASFDFIPDQPGIYRVMLLVKDSMGIFSQPVWATFPVNGNTPPVASAGPDQPITLIGTPVQLDGSQSYDPDGDIINYQWSFLTWPGSDAIPPTTQPTLIGETTAIPSFVAWVHGTYTLQLVVNDGQSNSAPSFVTVSFENIKPVANAGGNRAKVVGDTVTLNGSGTDANGDPLTYQWSLVSTPVGSSVTLNAATTATASFIADLPGDYVVGLTVNDGFINSDPNNITVTVLTKQDAATDNLASTVDVVNSLPPETLPTVFVNSNQANALTNKINAALKLIDQKQYAAALDKLQTDILPKTDGWVLRGAPDSNDWIKDRDTQYQVYAFVTQTIQLLQGMQ
jgi:hypothetical protein